jgi:hypothetical protein
MSKKRKMTKKRLNLRNVIAIAICLAVTSMMFSGCKDNNGDSNGNGNGNGGGGGASGIDITLSIKAGVNENEVIVVCSPAMPSAFMDMGGFPPFYFVDGYGADTYKPFNFSKTGGTGTIAFYMYESYWNQTGTEYTCVFETFGSGTWEGTVTLNPIGALVEGTGSFGIKSLKIGTNNPVTVKVP